MSCICGPGGTLKLLVTPDRVEDEHTIDDATCNLMSVTTDDRFRMAICAFDGTVPGAPAPSCWTGSGACAAFDAVSRSLNQPFPNGSALHRVTLPLGATGCAQGAVGEGLDVAAFFAFDTPSMHRGGLSALMTRLTAVDEDNQLVVVNELKQRYTDKGVSATLPPDCNIFSCARQIVPVAGDVLVTRMQSVLGQCKAGTAPGAGSPPTSTSTS